MRKKTRVILALILAPVLVLMLVIPVRAVVGEWSSSGNDMYYNDGKIGIGTSSPDELLTVNGTAKVANDLLVGSNSDTAGILKATATLNSGTSMLMLVEGEEDFGFRLGYNGSQNRFSIWTKGYYNGQVGSRSYMRIERDTGNICIGNCN
ncbi:MAG TPA: hypothetical protein VGA67_05390 [Candidatus Dojkabacteria bacterium]